MFVASSSLRVAAPVVAEEADDAACIPTERGFPFVVELLSDEETDTASKLMANNSGKHSRTISLTNGDKTSAATPYASMAWGKKSLDQDWKFLSR